MSHKQVTAKVIGRLFREAAKNWTDNKCVRLGAALAFYSVLSLAPLVLLVLMAATSWWGLKAAEGQIISQMRAIIGWQGAEAVQNILTAAERAKHGGPLATILGLLALFFSASGVFGELQEALNTIWKAPPRREKTLLLIMRERIFSFAMVASTSFLLLVSLGISAWLSSVSHDMNDLLPNHLYLMQVIDLVTSFCVIAFLFAVTFKTVPDVFIPWKSVWIGGALTSGLFLIGKLVIGSYLGYLGSASTYGAAWSFIALLLWVYYSAQILFFGAEFTRAYSAQFDLRQSSLHQKSNG